MIRITVELVSARGADRDRLLGVAYITNTGEQAPNDTCTYTCWLSKTLPGRTHETWQAGRAAAMNDADLLNEEPDGIVRSFDNVKRGVWDLLYLALKGIVGSRNV